MNSLKRILAIVEGKKPDRLPIWASRHNKNGFKFDTSEIMVEREVLFQKEFDWDMARISPAAAKIVEDWGCIAEGTNHLGVPKVLEVPVKNIQEWDKIKWLDPERGNFASIANAIKELGYLLKSKKPNLITIFSPLTLAQKVSTDKVFLETLKTKPQILNAVLDIFAQTMIDFANHCIDKGGDCLYFCTQTANYNLLTKEEAERFEKLYSIKVINAIKNRLRFKILHLHGDNIMIDHFEDYPIDILNWADRRTVPSVPLNIGRSYFSRGIMGGVNGRDTLCKGNNKDIEDEILDAVKSMEGKPFIISPCCVIPVIGLPNKNIHVMRNMVDKIKL